MSQGVTNVISAVRGESSKWFPAAVFCCSFAGVFVVVAVVETESEPEVLALADVGRLLADLRRLVAGVDVGDFGPDELRELTSDVRAGQQALDGLLIRIGMAAEHHHEKGRGRGAEGVLLGDGRAVRGSTARREAARSRTASRFGRLADAVNAGRLGGEHLDVIARAAATLSDEQQQELTSEALVETAVSEPIDVFNRWVRREADRIKGDHGLADTKARQAASGWKHWLDEKTGMGQISASFDPERYEAIITRVDHQLARLANAGGVQKNANLAARAAFELLTGKAVGGAGVPHINVVVDWETFVNGAHDYSVRETCGGHELPPESIARLGCDATIQRIVLDERGVPLNVGRKYRTATDAQWQAIRAVYRTCAWSRCNRPLAWTQLHHIHEWECGGCTDLCNLIPLCNKHHHAVHEGGWSVRLRPDRRLDIYQPDGEFLATARPDRLGRRSRRQGKRRSAVAEPAQPGGP